MHRIDFHPAQGSHASQLEELRQKYPPLNASRPRCIATCTAAKKPEGHDKKDFTPGKLTDVSHTSMQ